MELVAHVSYDMAGDIQFQRRSGAHTIDGVSVDTTTDLVFASAHTDNSRVDGGIEVIDITSPSKPTTLTRIPCPGYQSDVAVYETLLLQTLDHAGSNAGCDPEWLNAAGSAAVDRAGTAGVRIFDVRDPARPRLIHFVEVVGEIGDGVHDVTVLPWAGIAYLAQLNGQLGILDLGDPAFPYTAIDVSSISPEMKTSCHDIGLDPVRLLAFCAANQDETYVLDVRQPMRPGYLSKVVNAALSRHHGALMAPDGVTLVLESEYDHPPEVASDAPAGLWFYDLSEPADPELLGSWAPASCEPSEDAERACSSHWYNFVPGTEMLVAAWRHEGVFLVDYTDPAAAAETGFFSPSSRVGALGLVAGSDFWTAYFWHGHVYASSGGSRSGLYILRQDDMTDADPSPYDEGTSWGRWTGEAP
ncbi:MAG: LVIVD repeat-containing protein [Aeromicrobium sp.]